MPSSVVLQRTQNIHDRPAHSHTQNSHKVYVSMGRCAPTSQSNGTNSYANFLSSPSNVHAVRGPVVTERRDRDGKMCSFRFFGGDIDDDIAV